MTCGRRSTLGSCSIPQIDNGHVLPEFTPDISDGGFAFAKPSACDSKIIRNIPEVIADSGQVEGILGLFQSPANAVRSSKCLGFTIPSTRIDIWHLSTVR